MSDTPDDDGGCALCAPSVALTIWEGAYWRLVPSTDRRFPGYFVLVHKTHVGEMSDLAQPDQAECFLALLTVESVLREHMKPTKVNLAQLGNRVRHLHWHVVPRFEWDSHYPESIWGPQQREPDSAALLVASAGAVLAQTSLPGALAREVYPG